MNVKKRKIKIDELLNKFFSHVLRYNVFARLITQFSRNFYQQLIINLNTMKNRKINDQYIDYLLLMNHLPSFL